MMNEHIPKELQDKWVQYEFLGKPVRKANGKLYVRARYKFWPWQGHTHIYSFEDDWFWHDMPFSEVP